MTPRERQTTTVRLSPSLLARLDAKAQEEDVSRNAIIAAACRAYTEPEDEE